MCIAEKGLLQGTQKAQVALCFFLKCEAMTTFNLNQKWDTSPPEAIWRSITWKMLSYVQYSASLWLFSAHQSTDIVSSIIIYLIAMVSAGMNLHFGSVTDFLLGV